MTNFYIFATALVVSLALVPGAAVAQTNETNPVENTTVEDEIPDDLGSGNLSLEIGPETTLTDYDYKNQAFYLRIEADEPTRATVSEAINKPEGAGRFSIQREMLLPGENTIVIPVEKVNGESAITVVTDASIEQGTGIYVSTGMIGGDRPAIAWTLAQQLLAGTAVSVAAGTALVVRRRYNTTDEGVERVL